MIKKPPLRRRLAIGIDLGTTNTVAAIHNEHNDYTSEIVCNREGERFTRSAVLYPPDDLNNPVIGIGINDSIALKSFPNVIYDTKRLIGRSYDDAYVQSFNTKQKNLKRGFQLKRHRLTDLPCVYLENNAKGVVEDKSVTAEDVATEILKSVKEDVKSRLGSEINEAVISIPAYFSYAQRAATKRAAEKAGFQVMSLITEPVAAAIYYTYRTLENDIDILVVDLGGGTLDVSLIRCGKNKFAVKSVEGDMFLGGRDFDDVIFEHLKKKVVECNKNITYDTKKGERILNSLRTQSVNMKHKLTTNEKYKISVFTGDDDELELTLTREKFEKLAKNLFDRVINRVDKCLKSAGKTPDDVSKIVLAGGSTRIPKLQQMIKEYFNGKEIDTHINPDEAVAMGASIHASLMKNEKSAMQIYHLQDLVPHSLGILAKYDLMVSFIQKGAPLPISVTQTMLTCDNDQKSVVFSIYEGERKQCRRNKKLGQLVIGNLPPGKAGQVEFDVTFFLDISGLLKVSAVERRTKNAKQLLIKMDDLAVCEKVIFKSESHENIMDEEDKQFEDLCQLRLRMDTYCNGVVYDIEEPHLKANKHEILKCLSRFKLFTSICQDVSAASLEFQKLQQDLNALMNPQ